MNNSMQINYRIVHNSEERFVTARPVSIIAFERKWNVGFMTAIREPRLEWHAWLAHDACHREALIGKQPAVKPFDDWLADLQDIDLVEQDTVNPSSGGTR